jgi:SAM-dependent methyltransferase
MIVDAVHRQLIFGRRVRILADHIARLLPKDATVLDVGCGDGTVAESVMRRRPDVRTTGVDVLARPHARIDVQLFDGAHLPFDDAAFEVAMFIDVLHHTDDPTVLLREAHRVAKCVVLKDHTLSGVAARATLAAMDWIGNAHHGVSLPYNYWTDEQWREAFADVQLEIVRWMTSLHLYPIPFSWAFDRKLHFVALLSRFGDHRSSAGRS